MSRARTIVAAAALAGCGGRADRDPPRAQTEVARADAAAPAPTADAAPSLRQHMDEHFRAVAELQGAIVRGHLEQARAHAQYLVEHDEHAALDGWQPHVDAMRAAARAVSAAPDLPTAGRLTAELGRACSGCHRAQRAVVAFAWAPVTDDDGSLAAQMRRHQWGAARMWEGLVGPSDPLWTEGAAALAASRLDVLAATRQGGPALTRDLAERVHDLARTAATVTTADGRAALYGELLSTCATCHQLNRDLPPR